MLNPALLLLRACKVGLTSASFFDLTIGDVLDVITENANDYYEAEQGKIYYAGDDD